MASTISVNFASVDEVFLGRPDPTNPLVTISTAPQKKSVSARVLAEALGGGKVGGGYVQRTGGEVSQMTGFLYLSSVMPSEPLHAVPKKYVDDHAYTRRYHFVCRQNPTPSLPNPAGYLATGSTIVSGFDLNTNPLYFFDRSDVSREAIAQYVDVYRDGILQKFGANDDYEILNTVTFFGGTTAIRFNEPFDEGTTVQVNIGNVGALPLTFGVATMSAGYGLETTMFSGDVSMFVTPSSFAASSMEVSLSSNRDKFVSPHTLSAHPLVPRALGLFRKEPGWTGPGDDGYFGNSVGEFDNIRSFKLKKLTNDPLRVPGNRDVRQFRVEMDAFGPDTNYNAVVSINFEEFTDTPSTAYVLSYTRTTSSFDFFVLDSFGNAPTDIYEISIMVY